MARYVQQVLAGNPAGPRKARMDRPYRAFVPDRLTGLDYSPSRVAQTALNDAIEQAARLDAITSSGDGLLSKDSGRLARLTGLLSRSEGVASSMIEDYNATVPSVMVSAATGATDRYPSNAEVIRDGIHAVEAALVLLSSITPESIASVQARLLAHAHPAMRGYRSGYIQVGGKMGEPETAEFLPPPAPLVPDLVADLCAFLSDTDDRIHPIARAAIGHAQFETIHPFPDGNGRTGRTLIQAVLRNQLVTQHSVLPISLAIAESDSSKAAYVGALNAMRRLTRTRDDLDRVVTTFSRFVTDATTRALDVVQKADNAHLELLTYAASDYRADSYAQPLANVVATRLGVTASAAAAELGTSATTARHLLDAFGAAGLVDSRSGGKYGRVYFSTRLAQILEEATGAPMNHAPPATPESPSEASTLVSTGRGRGRPLSGPRCGKSLRTGTECQRRAGHTGNCRATR
ncbi:MAG: Fic family protein [Demequina sp.]